MKKLIFALVTAGLLTVAMAAPALADPPPSPPDNEHGNTSQNRVNSNATDNTPEADRGNRGNSNADGRGQH